MKKRGRTEIKHGDLSVGRCKKYVDIHDNNVCQFVKMVDIFPIMPAVNGARYELQPVHYEDLGKAYYQVLMNEKSTANKNFNLKMHLVMLRESLNRAS